MLLIRGSVSPEVKTLQENLNKIGVECDVDGIYGPGTEKAVKTFQTASGLTADGKYGDATHAKLEETIAGMGSSQA
ncbi:MAG: peptidoglycan-binding domain-containing protein [Byssovorax sp.]